MRVCALFSGGKDSTYALHWAYLSGLEIACLITMLPQTYNSLMFHRPGIELTSLQAKAMGFPQILHKARDGDEVKELKRLLKEVMRKYDVGGVVVGALSSDYQRSRINLICEELGLKTYSPLWRKDQATYLVELVNEGFKFILTSVSALGLTPDMLGKIFDVNLVRKLISKAQTYGFNPGLEGGEGETLVLDAPLFKKRLEIISSKIVRAGPNSWRLDIQEARLVNKCRDSKD